MDRKQPNNIDLSDSAVTEFLSFLQKNDFLSAWNRLDDSAKVYLPLPQLQSFWTEKIEKGGALLSLMIAKQTRSGHYEQREATLHFEKGSLRIAFTVHPQDYKIVGFLGKSFVFNNTSAPYVNPSSFITKDITFGRSPFFLGGTLTIPQGTGPFPAVLLVHGFGPLNRDGSIYETKILKDLAEGLSSQGIVVFRYDKRSYIYAARVPREFLLQEEVVMDAILACNVLKSQKEVMPEQIFVLGHSLGALLTPEIVLKLGFVAGAMLLSPLVHPPWHNASERCFAMGVSPKELIELERKLANLKEGLLGRDRVLGFSQTYWKHWPLQDGVELAKRVRRPLLLMRGGRDQYTSQEDFQVWEKSLKSLPFVELTTLPQLNHFLISGLDFSTVPDSQMTGHVAESAIERLVTFLTKVQANQKENGI